VNLEYIKVSEIYAYTKLFPQPDHDIFVEMIYHMDVLMLEHQLEKHNQELEKIKNTKR